MPNYITTLKMPNDDVYVIKDEAAQTLIESIKNRYFGNLVHQVDTNGNVYNFYKKNDTSTILATITLATTVTSTGDAANNPVTSGAVASAISDMASATDLGTLAGRVTTVENNYTALMNNADAGKVINSFNEVVAFLAGVTTDDTLIGKLNDLNSGKLADVKIESGKLKKKYTDTGGYDSGTNVVTDVQVDSTSVVSNGVASITLPTWSSLKPSGGIPSTDLASGVQTSLGKADSAVQGIKKNGKTLTLDSNKIADISDVVTTVKMNNTTLTLSKNSSTGAGEIDLGTVITAHQDISGKEDKAICVNTWISTNLPNLPSSEATAMALTSDELAALAAIEDETNWYIDAFGFKLPSSFAQSNVNRETVWTGLLQSDTGVGTVCWKIHCTEDNKYWADITPTTLALGNGIPDELADLSDDSTHRVVTDVQINAWNAKYDKPSGGIPKTDLASAVQTSLGKADSSVQTLAGSNDTAVAPNSAGNLKVNLTGSYANETLTLSIAVTAPST